MLKGVEEALNGRKVATLKDVAQLSGVSISTASKALSGRPEVHPQTRERVREAAQRIQFRPNTLARGLFLGRTGTAGLLANDLAGEFSIPVLMGVEDAFGAGEMSVFLCDSRRDPIRERHQMNTLLDRRVDGIIVVGHNTNPRPSIGRDLPIPVIYVYAPSEDPDDLSFVPDNVGAGELAAHHLLDTGRSRIAHITGEIGYLAAQDREKGIRTALDEAGVEMVGGSAMYGNWSGDWGRTAAIALLERHPDLDAIICGNDRIARAVLDVLRERGVSAPGSIAVSGFDNWAVFTDDARPQITSVDMNLEKLGRLAAHHLFAKMEGESRSGVHSHPCRLVVRASTARDL